MTIGNRPFSARVLLLPVLLVHLISCDKAGDQPASTTSYAGSVQGSTGGTTAQNIKFDPSSITIRPEQRNHAEWALVGQWLKENSPGNSSANAANLAISPTSLVDTLQGIWWGTRGDTALEVARWFEADPDAPVPSAGGSDSAGTPLGQRVTIQTQSAIWIDDGFPILDSYLKLLQERGLGTARTLDWANPSAALAQVNRWASEASDGKIEEIFAEGDLKAPIAYVMSSLIHFKAGWSEGFDPAATRTEDFTLLDGSRRPVSFLTASRKLRHGKLPAGGALLELPFADRQHRMIVALPADATPAALAKLEAACADGMREWLGSLEESTVNLALPKFGVRGSWDPRTSLQGLGVGKIFSDQDADFSGASKTGGLKLDAIRQQVRVQIDENGAEASAATAASVAPKSLATDAVEIRADRPFLFFILGKDNDLLFAGRVASPDQTAH